MALKLQNDDKKITQKLNDELAHFSFSGTKKVLKRTHPKTWQEKLLHWLNKEISVPVVPIGVTVVIFLSVSIVPSLLDDHTEQSPRQMIQVGGNYYWSDLYEAVRK